MTDQLIFFAVAAFYCATTRLTSKDVAINVIIITIVVVRICAAFLFLRERSNDIYPEISYVLVASNILGIIPENMVIEVLLKWRYAMALWCAIATGMSAFMFTKLIIIRHKSGYLLVAVEALSVVYYIATVICILFYKDALLKETETEATTEEEDGDTEESQ